MTGSPNEELNSLSDEDEIGRVYNRRKKVSSHTAIIRARSKRWADTKRKDIKVVDESTVESKVEGDQSVANDSRLGQAMHIDKLLNNHLCITRREPYSQHVGIGTLAHEFITHLKEQKVKCTSGDTPDEHSMAKCSNSAFNDLSVTNKDTDVDKGTIVSEGPVLKELNGDYSRSVVENRNESWFEDEISISSQVNSGTNTQIVDYYCNEVPTSRGSSGVDFDESLQRNSKSDNYVKSLKVSSIKVHQVRYQRDFDASSTCLGEARGNVIGRMSGDVNHTEKSPSLARLTQRETDTIFTDKETKKEIDDLAREAYQWAKEAFNFPKVKDYVATIENK